jgi:flagellar basal body-associated protein FliL
MPNTELSEMYFIGIMMFVIVIICVSSFYIFFKTFYKEKAAQENREKEKAESKE